MSMMGKAVHEGEEFASQSFYARKNYTDFEQESAQKFGRMSVQYEASVANFHELEESED